ncbi:MAG: ferredoxin-thioredoxin reductase catalytic domain-containing protein [Minisyncoccales bacterium]
MINQEKIRKLITEYEVYARKNGFVLNPNQQLVEAVIKSLLEREEKFGQRYCPCRRLTGNQEEDKKIICPCVYHQEEIKKNGHCLCGLFVRQ